MPPNASHHARASWRVAWMALLCRMLVVLLPTGKHQHGGMALERTSKNLRALDPKADAIILDRRNRGLRNFRESSQLILTEILKLTNNSNGLTN
jgi:hypothetical protein